MPSERFVEALNDQIGREFLAAHQYTAVGAYYDRLTFPRLAKFFFEQADEERGHAMRMVNYLNDTGSELRLGEVPAPKNSLPSEYEGHCEAEPESFPDHSITPRETDDYASESFMQWFVDEQVEEEASMQALLEVAERVREYPMMLEEFLARDSDELGSNSS